MIDREYLRFFESLLSRVGGVNGIGTEELSAAAFEDAGIEETKAALYALTGEFGQAPSPILDLMEDNLRLANEIEELRGLVAELFKLMANAQLGVTLQ